MALNLLPKKVVMAGKRVAEDDTSAAARATAIIDRIARANEETDAANARLMMLPSARPGYEGQPIAVATLMARESLSRDGGLYFSRDRLKTEAGLADLENWTPVKSNGALAEGSRFREQVARLAEQVRQTFPKGHPARQFSTATIAVSNEAWYILMRTGFMDRVKRVLGDEERGQLDSKNLASTLSDDAFDGAEWKNLILEMQNAKALYKKGALN